MTVCPKCNIPGCTGNHTQATLIVPVGTLMIAMQVESLFPVGFSFMIDPTDPTKQVMTLFRSREQAREFAALFQQALDQYDAGAMQPKTPAN